MKHFQWTRWMMAALCSASLSLASSFVIAEATDLPAGVLNYLKQKDPHVKVRFDGLISFPNGESYVPVIPQDPTLNPDSQHVISAIPEQSAFPDLIEFDNHFFLLRLIQTASGRLTFAKRDDYPIQLKEGLIPQDFVLPNNLFIPVELKVILGALPYNPMYTPTTTPSPTKPATTALKPTPTTKKPTLSKAPTSTAPSTVYSKPSTGKPSAVATNTQAKTPLSTPENANPTPTNPVMPTANATPSAIRSGYIFDLSEQKLFSMGVSPNTLGVKQTEVPLNCVPSSLKISPDGRLLFAPCLSSNELVVVDTGANLVKTRIAVGQRPEAIVVLEKSHQAIVSNRYSPYLSIIQLNELLPGERIDLPGNGSAMAVFQEGGIQKLVVADAFKPQIYIINPTTRQVEKTFKALSDISTLTVLNTDAHAPEIWMASRTGKKVMALDASTGTTLATLDVGQKPVEFAVHGDTLYVLCAGSARLDVIDWPHRATKQSIALEEDSFPSGLTAQAASKKAYITTASANSLVVLNLETGRIDATLPVSFRSNLIALTPDIVGLPTPTQAIQPTVPATSSPVLVSPATTMKRPEPTGSSVAPKSLDRQAAQPTPSRREAPKLSTPAEAASPSAQASSTSATGNAPVNSSKPEASPPKTSVRQVIKTLQDEQQKKVPSEKAPTVGSPIIKASPTATPPITVNATIPKMATEGTPVAPKTQTSTPQPIKETKPASNPTAYQPLAYPLHLSDEKTSPRPASGVPFLAPKPSKTARPSTSALNKQPTENTDKTEKTGTQKSDNALISTPSAKATTKEANAASPTKTTEALPVLPSKKPDTLPKAVAPTVSKPVAMPLMPASLPETSTPKPTTTPVAEPLPIPTKVTAPAQSPSQTVYVAPRKNTTSTPQQGDTTTTTPATPTPSSSPQPATPIQSVPSKTQSKSHIRPEAKPINTSSSGNPPSLEAKWLEKL